MTLPVIAIVGRPNVGKSTLFNYLTRTRNALVSDIAGMTRDRQYGEAELGNRRFIVIDTGGITDETNEIGQLTTRQALQAIEEADEVIFLLDARAGLTAADTAIANRLRAFNKPIQVVVNKAEGLDPDLAAIDFHRLGLGNPIPISAAHGAGISDLIINLLPVQAEASEPNMEGVCFAIVGRPNVGKSTLTNRLLGEERVIVFDQPGTTRDSIYIPFERRDKHYTLIDTAGIRRKGRVFEAAEKFSIVKTLQAIESAHVVLCLMDANEGVTEQDLHLLGYILEAGKALVIAYNKWDGLTPDQRKHAHDTLDRRLNFISFARIHLISALHGTDVGNLFDSINEAYECAFKKFSTSTLTKILLAATVQHAPPLVRGRRIKLRYAHTGGHNPPIIVIHGNQLTSLPDSYRRYLSHTFQHKLKLVGTPVRIEFKNSENPFREKRVKLTPLQQRKKAKADRRSGRGKVKKPLKRKKTQSRKSR